MLQKYSFHLELEPSLCSNIITARNLVSLVTEQRNEDLRNVTFITDNTYTIKKSYGTNMA